MNPALGNAHAALSLHRLDNHRRDRRIDFRKRPLVVERQTQHRPGQRAERLAHQPISGQRKRAHRVAVIRPVERHESRASGELARHLKRTLDRFRPAVGEIDALKRPGEKLNQPSRQGNLALDHVLAIHHDVQVAPRLLRDRGQHLGMSMAEGTDADPGDEIEIAASVRRDQPRSFGARYLQSDR